MYTRRSRTARVNWPVFPSGSSIETSVTMYTRAAVEIAASGRPPPHLSFDFDSSIMVSKLTANRTGVVDDCESTCSLVRQGIFIVSPPPPPPPSLFLFRAKAITRCGKRTLRYSFPSVIGVKLNRDKCEKCIPRGVDLMWMEIWIDSLGAFNDQHSTCPSCSPCINSASASGEVPPLSSLN